MMYSKKISKEITAIIATGVDVMEAILIFCETKELEIPYVSKRLSPSLLSELEQYCTSNRLIKS